MTTAPTTPIRAPRTMVTVMAALQAVALRIDEAGVTPDQIAQIHAYPYSADVGVTLASGEVAAFHSLLTFYPTAVRHDYTHDLRLWLQAKAETPDGTVTIVVRADKQVTA